MITFKSQYGTGGVVLYDEGGGGEGREGGKNGPFFKAQQDNPAIQPSNPGNR